MRLGALPDNLPSAAARIVKVDVTRLEILGYDIDNGYPQRMESLINASSTAKQAADKLKDFIVGQGFDKDQAAWEYVFNSAGQIGDEVLEELAEDVSKYDNCAVHINYNALFQGVEISVIPFKNCRLGIGKQAGKIAVSPSWWNNEKYGKYIREKDIDYIDMFDSSPEAIKRQVSMAGGWKNYKGQICLMKPIYTLCNFDSVIDDMEGEILSKKTSKNNIKNNFGDKVIWMQPEGDIFAVDSSDPYKGWARQDEHTSGLQEFVGPDAPQLIAAYYKSEADKPDFKTIENKLDDKKFAYTIENARANIYRVVNQPAILHSDLTQGRYNQNQLPEAMKYYNNSTEGKRIKMQRFFKKITSVWGEKLDTDYSITPLNDLTSATDNTEGANSNTNGIDNNQG